MSLIHWNIQFNSFTSKVQFRLHENLLEIGTELIGDAMTWIFKNSPELDSKIPGWFASNVELQRTKSFECIFPKSMQIYYSFLDSVRQNCQSKIIELEKLKIKD